MKKTVTVFLVLLWMCMLFPVGVFAADTVNIDGVIYSADRTQLIECTERYTENELVIPSGVQEICDGAFLNNRTVAQIVFPAALQRIGKDAFRDSVLNRIYMNTDDPLAVSELALIDDCAFFGCKNLMFVTLPLNVDASFGEYVFKNCSSMEQIILPDNAGIPDSTFIGCTALKLIGIGTDEDAYRPYWIGKVTSAEGKVTAADAREILRISAGLSLKLAYTHLSADVDRDGKITAADARKVLRAAANLEAL